MENVLLYILFLLLHEITGEERYLSYAEKHFAVIKKYFSQDVNYDLFKWKCRSSYCSPEAVSDKKKNVRNRQINI